MIFLKKNGCKFSILAMILLLHACSKTSTDQAQTPEPLIGHFFDNAVVGAQFVTPSFRGDTGSTGHFSYYEGETVEFYIGDIFLGAAVGQEYITPHDFSYNPLKESDEIYLPDDYTTNVVRFLQTVDSDGSVDTNDITWFLRGIFDNNITISPATTEAAQGLTVDFQQTVRDFETSAQVQETIAALTTPLSQSGEPRPLANINKALAHYTQTLTKLEGQRINWQTYLNPVDHQNSIYSLEENIDGSLQSREVALSYFSSLYGRESVWVRSWNDNWKSQTMDYILRNFDSGVLRIGGVFLGNQYIHPASGLLFYSNIINDQWIISPDYKLPSDALKTMKVVTNQFLSTPYQVYENTLKVTIEDNSTNSRETHWYVANVGLVKMVLANDNNTSTVSLIRQQQLTEIPVTTYNEKFLASREIFEHSETQIAHIQENLDNAFAALYLALLISGDLGTDKHRELFHDAYTIYIAEYSLSLTKKIIESSQKYALEAVTIEHIYNRARLYWLVNILLTALLHSIENSELIDKMLENSATIFQESMDLLNSLSIVDDEIRLKPITANDLE